MTFWTFLLLLMILTVFVFAQLVKLMNGDSKASELARSCAWSVINRIKGRKDATTAPSDEK